MRYAVLFFASVACVACAACGGRVDDPPPPSTTTPTGAPSPTPGANPSNAPSTADCAGVCNRFRACAPSFSDPECISSCGRDFADPMQEEVYAKCIQSIPCGEIERDLSLDFGPIGMCYQKASRR